MSDEGMGSLRLSTADRPDSSDRRFGRRVAEYRFKDSDDVDVLCSLNVDQNGTLFELDVWKANYTPLIKAPDNFGAE